MTEIDSCIVDNIMSSDLEISGVTGDVISGFTGFIIVDMIMEELYVSCISICSCLFFDMILDMYMVDSDWSIYADKCIAFDWI